MNHSERLARAEKAQRLIADPLLQEAFEALDAQYIKAWRDGKSVDVREDAHRYITLLQKVHNHLVSHLADGNMAKSQIREIEGRKRPF